VDRIRTLSTAPRGADEEGGGKGREGCIEEVEEREEGRKGGREGERVGNIL